MELCKYEPLGKVRTFHIEAIQIPIVYNKYGDYDPNGLLYVLEENSGVFPLMWKTAYGNLRKS